QALAQSMLGHTIDRRAGYHVFFLLRALERLAPGGRLAFIMPADTCEGVFARSVWNWITRAFCLEGVVTFTPDASPFPGVDTNALIFLIRRDPPTGTTVWAQCRDRGPALKAWLAAGLPKVEGTSLYVCHRNLDEALSTGLSRAPSAACPSDEIVLGNFVRIVRGIATGANDYFFLTRSAVNARGLPYESFVHALRRTRDVSGDTVTPETIEDLDRAGRPSLLLSLDGRAKEKFPKPVQDYISHGEALGLPQRPLIKSRRPWYKMETRQPPPFLFAYLGRRNARFIRNLAGVVPLTGFLCVYPHSPDPENEERLWKVLQHPSVVANLNRVGKSYGGGAIKVEPRALEQLPLPRSVLDANAVKPQPQQFPLI
ncbi:MAG: Eco57I restriction-modification methylase domain-containing protein, partial [Pyrinomonadaceae bacterium]